MKNILIEILSSRPFQIGGLGCLLFIAGIYFYAQWNKAGFEAALPILPVPQPSIGDSDNPTQTEASEALPHEHAHPHMVPQRREPAPRRAPIRAVKTPSRSHIAEDELTWPEIPNLLHHSHQQLPPPLPEGLMERLNALYTEDPQSFEELEEQRFDLLAGDMDIETTADFLETHQLYNSAILTRLDAARAFKYLASLPGHKKEAVKYAERAITDNPRNLQARMYLAGRGTNDAAGAAAYRAILEIVPNYVPAMNGLGSRLHYDHPEEAIQILKKVNRQNPTRGDFSLGRAYERLGDYKTAWIHYRKALILDPDGQLIYMHMDGIAKGEPLYKPIQRSTQTLMPPAGDGAQVPLPQETDVGATAVETELSETPLWNQPTSTAVQTTEDKYNARAAAAEQAYQEFQKLGGKSHQEFQAFIDWVQHAENEPATSQDFLSQQMKSHLTKGAISQFDAERIVRAFEILERYGPEEGLRHLQETDPEIAEQIRRNPPRH